MFAGVEAVATNAQRRATCPCRLDLLNKSENATWRRRLVSLRARSRSARCILAKGLEFRSVAIMACDDEIIPSQERIENVADDADLEVVYDTERHLLYVACTRARDHLSVTGVKPASEFLSDLMG